MPVFDSFCVIVITSKFIMFSPASFCRSARTAAGAVNPIAGGVYFHGTLVRLPMKFPGSACPGFH